MFGPDAEQYGCVSAGRHRMPEDALASLCVAFVISVVVVGWRRPSKGLRFLPVSDRAHADAPEGNPANVPYLTVPELWSPHLRKLEENLKHIWRSEVLAATTTERKAAGISHFARRAATSSPLRAAPELAALFEALHLRLEARLNERGMISSELKSEVEEASRLFGFLRAVARRSLQAAASSLPVGDDAG